MLPQRKIVVQKDKIDEENTSNEVDRNGKKSSTIGSGLPGNLGIKLYRRFELQACVLPAA